MPSQTTTVAKLGNSLAVRIPQGLVEEKKISEGDQFDLSLQPDGSILIRFSKRRFNIDDLVSRITAENTHPETDWGAPVGKEVW